MEVGGAVRAGVPVGAGGIVVGVAPGGRVAVGVVPRSGVVVGVAPGVGDALGVAVGTSVDVGLTKSPTATTRSAKVVMVWSPSRCIATTG